MNQKIKNVGLLTILPIFMIALAPDYIGDADAATQYSKGTPNQSFGSVGSPVCGGALCGESTTNAELTQVVSNEVPKVDPPVVGIISVNNFSGESPNTFNAIVEVSAGSENLENVQVLVESDTQTVLARTGGIFAHDSVINNVIIQAQDPNSVTAFIVDYKLND